MLSISSCRNSGGMRGESYVTRTEDNDEVWRLINSRELCRRHSSRHVEKQRERGRRGSNRSHRSRRGERDDQRPPKEASSSPLILLLPLEEVIPLVPVIGAGIRALVSGLSAAIKGDDGGSTWDAEAIPRDRSDSGSFRYKYPARVYDLAERALPVHLECTCSTLTVTFACADWRVVTVIHKWAETRPESGPAAFPSRSLDRNNRNARCRIVSPFTRVSPPGSHVPRTRGNGSFRFRTPPEIPRIPALAFSLERISARWMGDSLVFTMERPSEWPLERRECDESQALRSVLRAFSVICNCVSRLLSSAIACNTDH